MVNLFFWICCILTVITFTKCDDNTTISKKEAGINLENEQSSVKFSAITWNVDGN